MFSCHRPRIALLPLLTVGILAGGVLCAAPANGQLVNGSFEQGNFTGVNMASNHDTTQLFNGDTNITGWTAVNELSWDGDDTTFHVVPSDGRRFLDLTGYHDSQPEGGVQQILTLVPGASYTLGLDVGYNAMYPSPTVNGVTVSITEAGINQTFDNDGTGSGALIDSTFWKHYTFNFTPTAATNTLLLQSSAGSSGAFIGLDLEASLRRGDIKNAMPRFKGAGVQRAWPHR